VSIEQLNIYGKSKLEVAIERYQAFEPTEGYYLAFSGGKDSVVIKALADMAKIKYDAHYNITGIDPPELVYFIREQYPEVERHQHKKSIFKLMDEATMPPTRMARYCCKELKEHGGDGRFVITGVRWAESARRKSNRNMVEVDRQGSKSKKSIEYREKFNLLNDNDEKRMMIENCTIRGKHILNPIIDWSDEEVWEFIYKFNIPYCKLYDEGFERVGCIGCPMSHKSQIKTLERFPKFKENYTKAFERMVKKRNDKGLETTWKTGEEVMKWWIN